jgi:hypothetical protein
MVQALLLASEANKRDGDSSSGNAFLGAYSRIVPLGTKETLLQHMPYPNFLIIGDLKAGTTSLHYYLKQHPQTFLPDKKELRFFSFDPDNSYHRRSGSFDVKTLSQYLAYFEHAGDSRAIGEASPNYLRSPLTAERIRQLLPDVRLIVSLRNPADRLYSSYAMEFRAGGVKEPIEEILFRRDSERVKASFYWSDLIQYYDRFARDQIKVILFDDLVHDCYKVIHDLYRFIGVDDSFTPDVTPRNVGGIPTNPLMYRFLGAGKKIATRYVKPTPAIRRIWQRVQRKQLASLKPDPVIQQKILAVCKDDIERTQSLIDRDLSDWFKE